MVRTPVRNNDTKLYRALVRVPGQLPSFPYPTPNPTGKGKGNQLRKGKFVCVTKEHVNHE